MRLPLALKMKELGGRKVVVLEDQTPTATRAVSLEQLGAEFCQNPDPSTSRLSGDLHITGQGGSKAASKIPGKAARATNQAS